jgi:hypothetical protein
MAVDRQGTASTGWTNKMGHGSAKGACRSATKVVVVVAVGVATAVAGTGTAVVVVVAAAVVVVVVVGTIAAGWTAGEENTGARLETWDGDSGHPYAWKGGQWGKREGDWEGHTEKKKGWRRRDR